MHKKRLYTVARITLALIAVAGVSLGQVDTVSDTIPKQYDYYLDSPPEEYYIPPVQTPTAAPKAAAAEQYGVDGENANIPSEQSDITTSGQPAPDTLNIRVPRSQEELGHMSADELYRLAFRRAAPERPRNLIMRLFVEGRAFGNTDIVNDSAFASFNFISPQLSRYLDTLLLPEARGAAGDSVGYFNSALLEAAGYVINANEQMYELHITVPPDSKILQKMSLGGGYAWRPSGVEVKPAAVSFYMNYRAEDNIRYSDYHHYGDDFTGFRYDDEWQREPLYLDLDGALNVYGWVLEGSGYAREPREGRWARRENFSRGDVRLVRDIVPWRARATAGDVSMGSDLLYGEAVGGLRYEYNDWFFGGEPSSAQAKAAFFMPRAGEVELYMDGRFQQRFRLPAGNHEISGFGGNVGRNKVRLVLRMDDGGVEEVPYEFILGDPRNMLKGESRYTVTAGVRRVYASAPMTYDYDMKEPAAGADILYGLLPSVSTGAAAQASDENGVAAMQVLWNMGGPGWLNARAYGNRSFNSGNNGARADLNYTADLGSMVKALDRAFLGGNGLIPNMSLSLRGYWQSLYYSARLFGGGVSGGNADMAGVSGNYGFGILWGSVSASGGAAFNRDTPGVSVYYPLTWNYGLRVSQSIRRATFSVNAGANVRGGVHRPYFSAFTNYALGMNYGRHRFSTSGDVSMRSTWIEPATRRVYYTNSTASGYDLDDDSISYEYDNDSNTIPYGNDYDSQTLLAAGAAAPADPGRLPYYYEEVKGHNDYRMTYGANAGWRWSNGSSGNWAQSYAANVGLRDKWGIPNAGASSNNSFNRAQLWLNYSMADYESYAYNRMSHTFRGALSGSFMFADGLWGFGRQTNGGFMLIDTRDNLNGAAVHVNRSRLNRRDYSRNGWFGAAYQNYLMSYRPTEVTVSLTDVPPGALLESNIYHADGAYKQGYALRLGSKPEVIIQVRLTDNGRPLRYAYATIEPEKDWGGAQEKRATFTNGDGELQLGGLSPGGKYLIKFASSTHLKDVAIEIPNNADPIIELPDIAVEREE